MAKRLSDAIETSAIFGVPTGFDFRPYPTGLETILSSRERMGCKAAIDVTSRKPNGGFFHSIYTNWVSGLTTYGNVELENVVFDVENRRVVSVELST